MGRKRRGQHQGNRKHKTLCKKNGLGEEGFKKKNDLVTVMQDIEAS